MALFLCWLFSCWQCTMSPEGGVDADGRVGGVHRLAAGATRAHDLDLEILGIDGDVHVLELGHDGHRGGRGVNSSLRLGRRHTLHAVDARLILELRVGALALDAATTSLMPRQRRSTSTRFRPASGAARRSASTCGKRSEAKSAASSPPVPGESRAGCSCRRWGPWQEQHLEPLLQAFQLRAEVELLLAGELAHLGSFCSSRASTARSPVCRWTRKVSTNSRKSECSLASFCMSGGSQHLGVRQLGGQLLEAGLDRRQLGEQEIVEHQHRARGRAATRFPLRRRRVRRAAVLLVEALDAAAGIQELLLARVERVAVRADIHMNDPRVGRSPPCARRRT